MIRNWGQDQIGLDAVFKIHTDGYGVSTVVVTARKQDKNGNWHYRSFLVAIGIAQNYDENQLTSIISKLQAWAEEKLGHDWTPRLMIDKDTVEIAMAKVLDLDFILCRFHSLKTFYSEIPQLCKGDLDQQVKYLLYLFNFERCTTLKEVDAVRLRFNKEENCEAKQYIIKNWLAPEILEK